MYATLIVDELLETGKEICDHCINRSDGAETEQRLATFFSELVESLYKNGE